MTFSKTMCKEIMKYNRGDIFLQNSPVSSLPENLVVDGRLELNSCQNLKDLPKGLCVKGALILRNCKNLVKLPEGLTVGGSLWIEDCANVSLPKNFVVAGQIF